MGNISFLKRAMDFSNDIAVLIIIDKDDDSVDEKYMAFTEKFAKQMIEESSKDDFDLDDAIQAIKLVQSIPDYHGDTFEGAIPSDMPEAIVKILTPARVFGHMLKTGTPPNTEIVLNGVKMTLNNAMWFYHSLAGVNAHISNCYKDSGTVNIENDYFKEMGFNPFQQAE
jgi:hypothetical protein